METTTFWSVPPTPKTEYFEEKSEDDFVTRIHVRVSAAELVMGESKDEDSPVAKKKKMGFCQSKLMLGTGEAELHVWLAQGTSVRMIHVVIAGKFIEIYLGSPPRLSSSSSSAASFSYPNNIPNYAKPRKETPNTPKAGLRVALPRTPPPPPVPKPIHRVEIPGGELYLNSAAATVAYRRIGTYTQLYTLSIQAPLITTPPSSAMVCLQPSAPLLVSIVRADVLPSLLEKCKAAGSQGLGVPESSLVNASCYPLNHPFQRVMDEVHTWVQLANIYHPSRKRMGTVLTDVNGNKYMVYAQQIENVVVVIFSIVALWQTWDNALSAFEEAPSALAVCDKLPPRCFMWPDRPEQGYSGIYFKEVEWSECAPPAEPIWGLVAARIPPEIFIRLLLALLLDITVLVHSKDPWLLLQTLEAVRALRLPPCPLECYFPFVDSGFALQRIMSPTAVVLGCLTEASFDDLDTILQEVSTCILVIDLNQPISKQRDAQLLSALETSTVFRSTHPDVTLALRPLSFVLNPKKYGLMPTLYNNLSQACVAAQDPHGGGLALVKDAFGNILDDILSFSPWWTCATDTVVIAEKPDLSSSPSYLDSSFALTHAFGQWRSFSRRYLGDTPICNVRPALIRARSLIPTHHITPVQPGSTRNRKKSLKSSVTEDKTGESGGRINISPAPSPSASPASHLHTQQQQQEEVIPPHQLLVGEQGVYLKFNNEGLTRTNHRMTLEQSSLLKISHLLIEALPKLTTEPECRMVIGDPPTEDTFDTHINRSPRTSANGRPSGSSISPVNRTKVPQGQRVRVQRTTDNGVDKADPERSSGSAITHSDLVGGVGNTSVIIGNVLAEEVRQRSPAVVSREEGDRSEVSEASKNTNDDSNHSVHNSELAPPIHVRMKSGKDESPTARRSSCSGGSSSSSSGDIERSSGASERGSLTEIHSARSQSVPGASEAPPTSRRANSQEWYSFLTPQRSSIEGKKTSSADSKAPPPPPPPSTSSVPHPMTIPPPTIRTESGFLGFRRSPKAAQDVIQTRPVVPLQRGMNSSRSPGQWLEDSRSNTASGLDLAVPLKYAGLLLRAIEADSINQREGSKKKLQEASKNKLLRALDLARSGSNSPIAEEKKSPRLAATPRRPSPTSSSSRIFDESDRTPRRGNFKTPSPNSSSRRFHYTNGGLPPSKSNSAPLSIKTQDSNGNINTITTTDDDKTGSANGRLDEDNVVSNVWSNLDALRVGIDGQPQLLIPKFRPSEVIFEYEIASGVEGSVFRGHLLTGKTVAIKVAKAQAVGEEENGFDTLSEAYYLLSLKAKKPDIAVVTCLGVVAITPPNSQQVMPCLVLEWCESSLAKMFQAGDVYWSSLLVRVGVCIQLTQAVLDVHENGVLHRDLRPEHVLITEHKTVVLTDFGLAEAINTPRFLPLRTPAYYRAPELDCNGYLDSPPLPADVFALGRIFSVIIAKQLPPPLTTDTQHTETISCNFVSKALHSLIGQCTRPFGIFHSKRYDLKQVLTELLEIEKDLVDHEIKLASHNTHNDPALYVQGIARAMRMNPTLRLHEKACFALTNIQLTTASAPQILTVLTKEEPRLIKGCEEVKFFLDSLYLACNVLFSLLSHSQDNAKKLFEAGCTDLARAVLSTACGSNNNKSECTSRESHNNRFSKLHSQFAAKACTQLDKLVASSDKHAMLARGGCTEVLLVALKLFSRSCDVQLPAFSALGELSVEPDTRAILLQHLDLFVTVMKIHTSVAYVQEHACKIIRTLASNGNLLKLVKAGCIELVITMMRTHPAVAALQAHACAVIKDFAFAPENRTILLNKGCIDLILLAMKTHQRTASVQFWGSGVLWTLASHPDTRKKLLNIQTTEVLLAALETHPGDPTVQQNSVGALSRLAPSNGRIRSDGESGSLSPKIPYSGRSCHRDMPPSPVSPLRSRKEPILRPSPLSREDSSSTVATRCLDLLLFALKNHTSNTGVVKTLCGAIKAWGATSGNKNYLKQNACEELLKQALKQHEPLKTEIVGALAVLM